ncbi:hypothetical protein BDZ89DRAFT_1147150 [Hymenopellis radicata]|nr:hypothetical protein BDZ89DRAFT_1147150 [Hymenopellis radicata]
MSAFDEFALSRRGNSLILVRSSFGAAFSNTTTRSEGNSHVFAASAIVYMQEQDVGISSLLEGIGKAPSWKLANYAKPTSETTSTNLFPLEQTTDGRAAVAGSVGDELRRASELRARKPAGLVPLAFPMIQKDRSTAVSDPELQPALTTSSESSPSASPASSPVSSTDSVMYTSFVEKWCFVGGVGA